MNQRDPREWVRWAEYVLASIEAHNREIETLWDKVEALQLKVNTLEVKSAIYGAVLGFIAGIGPSLISLIISKI